MTQKVVFFFPLTPLSGIPCPCCFTQWPPMKLLRPTFLSFTLPPIIFVVINHAALLFNHIKLTAKQGNALNESSSLLAFYYLTDSADLELYLESLNVGDIVIAVVADDGAKKWVKLCYCLLILEEVL